MEGFVDKMHGEGKGSESWRPLVVEFEISPCHCVKASGVCNGKLEVLISSPNNTL